MFDVGKATRWRYGDNHSKISQVLGMCIGLARGEDDVDGANRLIDSVCGTASASDSCYRRFPNETIMKASLR